MSTYLTESRTRYTNDGNPDHPKIGQEILTVTLWADGERIQNFGGAFDQDEDEVKANAAKVARIWEGTTAQEIREYDLFVKNLD